MFSPTLGTATLTVNAPQKGIVWLASYPTSGNTWFRIFLRNLLAEPEDDGDIYGVNGLSSSRDMFDELSGLDSSNLSAEEIDKLRPKVYQELVRQSERLPIYLKAHDAFTYLPNGQPLLSPQASAGAIYFLRNPLDVAVSYAYHAGHEDFAKSVTLMGRERKLCSEETDTLYPQLVQNLLDWSGHVRSWADQTDVPVHVVRSEDMLSGPLETFRGAIRFAGQDHDDSQILAALDAARFEKLQEKEREHGFRERLPKAKAFFREGKAGAWRNKLTEDLVARVIADHGDVMRRFHYLGANL